MINMYEYSICNQADEDIFYKQCTALEKNIPDICKSDLLTDVDSSLIQVYQLNKLKIKVYNDTNIGAVYIKSQVDLDQFFN